MEIESQASQQGDGMQLIQEMFTKCLKHGLREPSLQAMQQHFPALALPLVEALRDVYRQVLTTIEAHSQAEFQDICNEQNLAAKLLEMERLQAKQTAMTATTASTREAAMAAKIAEAAALLTAKQQEAAELQQMLQEASRRRNRLQDVLTEKQASVANLTQTYRSAAGKVHQLYIAATSGNENVPMELHSS